MASRRSWKHGSWVFIPLFELLFFFCFWRNDSISFTGFCRIWEIWDFGFYFYRSKKKKKNKNKKKKNKSKRGKQKDQTLLDLPSDLLKLVTSRLPLKDNIRASTVCKTLHEACVSVRVPDKSPWLIHFSKTDGSYELYDPTTQKTYNLAFPELSGYRVCLVTNVQRQHISTPLPQSVYTWTHTLASALDGIWSENGFLLCSYINYLSLIHSHSCRYE